MVNIGNNWDNILKDEFQKDYYLKLREFLKKEYSERNIYPDMHDIFNALRYTDYDDVKVVIIGQDPYHGQGQAHGLSFSVQPGIKQPPSLVNIFKELRDELGIPIPPPDFGCLTKWAKQGVLLLNACLTVREKTPNSHKGKGWEILTDTIIRDLNEREKPMVFILWGNNAKAKAKLVTNSSHLIITGSHPSPLSAYNGFFGGGYFSKANEFLKANEMEEIDWNPL